MLVARGSCATDLNQGVVYGVLTDETGLDEVLINRLDYDHIFGTVLNRFCIQAAIGHPLTVYGRGGQTRGFLDIRDTIACIELAVQHPASPASSACSISSPSSSTSFSLRSWFREQAKALGLAVEIQHLPNPRVESKEHYYNAKNTNLRGLGLVPTTCPRR